VRWHYSGLISKFAAGFSRSRLDHYVLWGASMVDSSYYNWSGSYNSGRTYGPFERTLVQFHCLFSKPAPSEEVIWD
jgi:hypothetical protein